MCMDAFLIHYRDHFPENPSLVGNPVLFLQTKTLMGIEADFGFRLRTKVHIEFTLNLGVMYVLGWLG